MTALQDWLSIRPAAARSIKAVIRAARRGLTHDESGLVAKPQLMGRGLERC